MLNFRGERGRGGGVNKMHQRENYQGFLKWSGVFLGHFGTTIKCTEGFFFLQLLTEEDYFKDV